MPHSSDFRNAVSSGAVPFFARDAKAAGSYNWNMASRVDFDWFLADWIRASGLEPKDLREKTGWSKRKMSELLNGKMRYNRDVMNEAARAMNLSPFELLLHPADANEIKRLRAMVREEAVRIAAEQRLDYKAPEAIDGAGDGRLRPSGSTKHGRRGNGH